MSGHKNPRRGNEHLQDNGPTYEGNPPSSGCNSTHVARSRSKWKRRGSRAFRRTEGESLGKFRGDHPPIGKPDPKV